MYSPYHHNGTSFSVSASCLVNGSPSHFSAAMTINAINAANKNFKFIYQNLQKPNIYLYYSIFTVVSYESRHGSWSPWILSTQHNRNYPHYSQTRAFEWVCHDSMTGKMICILRHGPCYVCRILNPFTEKHDENSTLHQAGFELKISCMKRSHFHRTVPRSLAKLPHPPFISL